ncbi:hypothetical protein VTK56DRAFT_8808 [Thermocarpiscus australiensis]
MAPFKLAALPDDIIREVCILCCSHCTWVRIEHDQALSSFCRVSRRFRYIAQPILYHHFFLDFKGDFRLLVLFLRTLVERPDLASQVRKLSITAGKLHRRGTADADVEFELLESIVAASSTRLGVARPVRMSAHGFYCAVVQLLVALSPRVEYLRLELDSANKPLASEDMWVFNQLADSTVPPRPLLPCLKRIRYREVSPYSSDGATLGTISSLLSLAPNLQEMEVVQNGGGVGSTEQPPLALANVVKLDIQLSEASHRHLEVLLASCGSLQEFRYVYDFENDFELFGVITRRQVVQGLLRRHRDSLWLLHLQRRFPTVGWKEGEEVDTLKPFVRLEHLTIEADWFGHAGRLPEGDNTLLVDALPRSLRDLILHGVRSEYRRHIREIARRRHLFPALRHVAVYGLPSMNEWREEERVLREKAFAEAGIILELLDEWWVAYS